MKKWIVMVAALVFVAGGFAFAAQQAWGPRWTHGFRGHGGQWMSQRILSLLDNDQFRSRVNLTDDQVSHLRQIVTNAEKSNIQMRAQMRVDGIDLRQLLEAEKPDQDAVMKKVQQITDLRGQMMKSNVQALLEAKAILSPEQQEKLRQFIGERFGAQSWGRSRRGPHRGPMSTRPGTPPQPPTPPATPPSPSQ